MQRFYYILFILISVISYGQVTVFTDINTKEAKINEPLVLTVVQEVVGDNMDQQTPLQLMDLSKFDIVGSASERNTFIDPKRGIRINQLVYQLYLQPKIPGKVKIGSALVTVNGKIYKSEPFDVVVKEGDRRAEDSDYFSKDVYLDLEVEDKVVYENQPTVAVLRAYSKNFDNFRKLENIQVPQQNDARIKQISYKKQDIESTEGDYSSQVVAMFVIFPEKSGNVEISPVSAFLKTSELNKIISNKVKLNVIDLPKGSPENFKNAVGKFKVNIISPMSNQKVEIGKPIDVSVSISGLGNLDLDMLPKIIESKDYHFYKPKITSHLATSKNGVKGEIVAKYILVPKKEGQLTISTEKFSYFNPELNKYIDLGTQSLMVNVLNAQQMAENKTTLDMVDDYTKVVMETVKLPAQKNKDSKYFTFNFKYILGNLSLIFGVFFLFFILYKIRNRYTKIEMVKPITTISEEEQKIRAEMKPDFSVHFEYLKNLKNNGNFSEFFNAYEELHNETERYIEDGLNVSFETYIDERKGAKFVEEFRNFLRSMSIEKYAPVHEIEHIETLYSRILNIYSEILK